MAALLPNTDLTNMQDSAKPAGKLEAFHDEWAQLKQKQVDLFKGQDELLGSLLHLFVQGASLPSPLPPVVPPPPGIAWGGESTSPPQCLLTALDEDAPHCLWQSGSGDVPGNLGLSSRWGGESASLLAKAGNLECQNTQSIPLSPTSLKKCGGDEWQVEEELESYPSNSQGKKVQSRHRQAVQRKTTQASEFSKAANKVGITTRFTRTKVIVARMSKFVAWLAELEEPVRTGRLAGLVASQWFETLCAAVIFVNSVFTLVAVNYAVHNLDSSKPSFLHTGDTFFLVFYIVELTLKIKVHGLYFFVNSDMRWNIFDLVLVIAGAYEYYAERMISDRRGTSNVTFMRSFRVMKITRVFRIFRVIRFFRELRTMLHTIVASIASLFWCLVMLVLILVLFGMVFVQGVTDYLQESEDLDSGSRQALMANFGSVQNCMVTLYMSTTGGDDWYHFYGQLKQIGSWLPPLLIFYVAFFNFAVYNVLTGIFVDHTQKIAQKDRDVLILEQRRKEGNDVEQLRRLCEEIDSDKSGTITLDEFTNCFQDTKNGTFLASIGLDISDAEVFFHMLSGITGREEVDIESFVEGCMRLKGNATSIDMQSVAFEVKLIHSNQRTFNEYYCKRLDSLSSALATALIGFRKLSAEAGAERDPPAKVTPQSRVSMTRPIGGFLLQDTPCPERLSKHRAMEDAQEKVAVESQRGAPWKLTL